MLHRATCFLKIGVVTTFAIAAGTAASADQAATTTAPEQRSRDVLARIDAPPGKPGWITRHLAIDYSNGIGFSQTLFYGNRSFDLNLRGPVYTTPLRSRNYGLKLELRF